MEAKYTVSHFIDGHWICKGDLIDRLNPANTQLLITKCPIATKAQVQDAVDAAQNAFQTFRKTPAPYRGELIHNLGELVRNNKKFLAKVITEEIGKPIRESFLSMDGFGFI